MPTIKIAELPKRCTSWDHTPAQQANRSPGIYEHTCSECGEKSEFTVDPAQAYFQRTYG